MASSSKGSVLVYVGRTWLVSDVLGQCCVVRFVKDGIKETAEGKARAFTEDNQRQAEARKIAGRWAFVMQYLQGKKKQKQDMI